DLQVTTFIARAPVGTTRTIDLSFAMPVWDTQLDLVPSARLRPMKWTWGQFHFDDLLPKPLSIGAVHVRLDPHPGWAIAGLLPFAFGAALLGDGWGRAAVAAVAGDGDEVARRRARI